MENTSSESAKQPPAGRPLATVLAVLAGLFRLAPHWWNFHPVGALSLFTGARLSSWHAFALPLALMLATDLALTYFWHYPFLIVTELFVYLSFLINVLLGRLLRQSNSPLWIGSTSLFASVQFFVVTNFGMWLTSVVGPLAPLYPPTLAGLVECYIEGLPFFGGTLLGDLLFTGALFGLHAALARQVAPAETHFAPSRA